MNETRVVPVEATPEMLSAAMFGVAGIETGKFHDMARACYAAMLSAAPPTADAQVDDARDGARWRKLCAMLDAGSVSVQRFVEFHPSNGRVYEVFYPSEGLTEYIDAALTHAQPQEVPGVNG